MKVNFTFTPRKAFNLKDVMWDLFQNEDFSKYLKENEDVTLVMQLQPKVKQSEKERMYAYYHGPLLGVAVLAFTDAGYEMMDKVKADYLLKLECAKATMVKNGEEEIYLEDKSKMTKDRLYRFISDCIFFLEDELNIQGVPDAESYRNREATGHGFKSVKHMKDE